MRCCLAREADVPIGGERETVDVLAKGNAGSCAERNSLGVPHTHWRTAIGIDDGQPTLFCHRKRRVG